MLEIDVTLRLAEFTVEPQISRKARLALDRMIQFSGRKQPKPATVG